MVVKGQVIAGRFNEVIARQKSGEEFQLGELVIADMQGKKSLLQVYDLLYGSQLPQQHLEMISGLSMDEQADVSLIDEELRTYKLAILKNLLTLEGKTATTAKELPEAFSPLREPTTADLQFLLDQYKPFFLGNLRSGSKTLDLPITLDAEQVFSHHVLIVGTTGKGKSVLMSNLIWDAIDAQHTGMLVLDPHDEYYLRNGVGMSLHPKKERVLYYAKNPPRGQRSLTINLRLLKPEHFDFIDFSGPQKQAMQAYYKEYGERWIEGILLEKPLKVSFVDATVAVLKRRMRSLLDLDFANNQIFCNGAFQFSAGESTITDIAEALMQAKTIIINTSNFSGNVELLIGSIIATEIYTRYKLLKMNNELNDKPVISIVLEEAPRVLGKEALEQGQNIFSTLAREGRKFKVGLTAITQLPSLIPREILANMNTKIILGVEMQTERIALIESCAHDLSKDQRTIASLDKGEAIVSSNFAKFAIPIKIPFFDERCKKAAAQNRQVFGMRL
ncbi:MAG: ATP-binding protein [archaeon]